MGEEEKEKAVWPLQATVGSACLNVMRLQERKNPIGEKGQGGEDSVAGLSVLLCGGDGERLPAKSFQFWEWALWYG
jgi:hypothetical protein